MATEQRRIFAVTDDNQRPLVLTTSKTLAEDVLRGGDPDEELLMESHEGPATAEDTVWVRVDETHQIISIHARRDEADDERKEADAKGDDSMVMSYEVFQGAEDVQGTEAAA